MTSNGNMRGPEAKEMKNTVVICNNGNIYGNYLSFFVIKNAVSCWIGVMRAAFRKRPILYGCIIAVGVMHVSV